MPNEETKHEPCKDCGGKCNEITPEALARGIQVGTDRKAKFTRVYYGLALLLPTFAYLWQGIWAAGIAVVLFGMYFVEAQVTALGQQVQILQQRYLQEQAKKKIEDAIGRSDDSGEGQYL